MVGDVYPALDVHGIRHVRKGGNILLVNVLTRGECEVGNGRWVLNVEWLGADAHRDGIVGSRGIGGGSGGGIFTRKHLMSGHTAWRDVRPDVLDWIHDDAGSPIGLILMLFGIVCFRIGKLNAKPRY